MKNKLLVISILLIIIIIVSYYWLNKRESLIETFEGEQVYIYNTNTDGTVNPILDAKNKRQTSEINTYAGQNIHVYIGEGIEEINGFFNQDSLSSVKNNILKVQFPSTLKKIGINEFKDYSNLGTVVLPFGIEEIGPNAFRGTAITSVNLPKNKNSFKKNLWNHTDVKDLNSWLSYKPILIGNIYPRQPQDTAFFKDKWTIVYNNKYYPIHDVSESIRCDGLGVKSKTLNQPFVKGVVLTCKDRVELNTGIGKHVNEIYGDKHHDVLYGTKVDNIITSNLHKYVAYNYTKVNKDSITADTIREIRKAYENNKFPFEDNVNISYLTSDWNTNIEKHEYTGPNASHIQTIEKYITDTENIQLATYRNVKDVIDIASNSSSGGYSSVDKGRAYKDTKINIVDGVVALGESLFENNRYLETIIIPSSVKYIKDNCFKSCTKLKNVFFYPVSQLISIGNNAFQGCTNLNTIHLPDSLQTIGYQAFQGCTNLRVYINPSSKLKVVAMDAFDETISKVVLPAQTQFAPSPNKSINELIKTGLTATTSVTNTINNTLASRYVSQTILFLKHYDAYQTIVKSYEVKDYNNYYFYYFYPPANQSSVNYTISFYSSLLPNGQINAKILLVGGGGSGGGGNAFSWGAGGGGGGQVLKLDKIINSQNEIKMKVGHGARWNHPSGAIDCANGHCYPNDGHYGDSSTLILNNETITSKPGAGGAQGRGNGRGGTSGSNNLGGVGYGSGGKDGGGGGGGGQTGAGNHNGKPGGTGGSGNRWIDNQGYGGGGGGGGWFASGGSNDFGGGYGGTHYRQGVGSHAGSGRKGSGGGGGGASSQSPHQSSGDFRNQKRIGYNSGRGGDGSCVFAFKKSDFDKGGWKLQLVPIEYGLYGDGKTINESSYNRQKKYDIYQNKTSNIVSIINKANTHEKIRHVFLTVPFPIGYYDTNKFSNDVLKTQTQDIQRRIKSIQKAEGIITQNIQIISQRIKLLPVPKLIQDMNNAYVMDNLPSLTDFKTSINSINSFVNAVEAEFINVIIEKNKEQFQLELDGLKDDRDELQRQITDAETTNKARIQKRLDREKYLATAETDRKQEINNLKQSAGGEAEKATETWYNQYKINYNLDNLDSTITNKKDSIELYHQNVEDSTTLNLLDNSLNNLDEVYNRVNDQNMSTEIERNMLDLELKNIGKETVAREKELQKLQKEDIKLNEKTKQIKNRLKLRKLDEIISENNMDLNHVNDTIKQQRLFTDNVKDLVQDKKNKSNILGHAYTSGDNIIQSQQQLIDDNIKTQDKYQIEKFTNLNKYNMKYMDPKYEDYRLNQENCDQLLNEFESDKYCEEPYFNINKDKCITKEICENRNNNNELENEMYINPGTRKRFKDNKDNYHYNYTNTMNMSLGILTLCTMIYKIK